MTDPFTTQSGSPGYGSPTPEAPIAGTTGSTNAGSTSDVAKGQASRVAGDAAEGGKHVAHVAKDEAASVAGEAKHQAASLWHQAGSELSSHASDQKDSLVTWLRQLADELRLMADSTSGSQSPQVASGLAQRGAEYAQQTAAWLGDREPRAVLDEVGSFARRRPGTFLLIAAGAGLLVGRLTRGLAAGSDEDSVAPQERRMVTPDIPVASARASTGYASNGGAAVADSWAGGPAVEEQWAAPAAGTPVTERVAPYREGEP